MGNTKIPKVSSHKHLGVTVQNTLKWTEHIKNIYTTCARKIGILRRLRKKLHPSIFKKIYVGVIRPKLEYGCAIWSGGPTSKLLNLQRTFCRRHHISLPPLQKRFDYFTLMLFFKIRMREAPKYLHNILPDPTSRSGYNFRKSSYPVPTVSRTSTLTSFLPRAIILWNGLPADLQLLTTSNSFKSALKKYLKLT